MQKKAVTPTVEARREAWLGFLFFFFKYSVIETRLATSFPTAVNQLGSNFGVPRE